MRNLYTFLMIVSSTMLSMAQPQLNNTNCFQTGDSSTLGFALVLQGFDSFIPQTGSNYTWDFSTTGFPGPWGTWTAPTIPYLFQPSSQSTHVPLQSTQINEYANVGMARDHFFTYSTAADTLYYNGYYSGGTSYVYYAPLPYLVFPMNFGDSVSVVRPILNATGSVQTGTVNRSWKYDGFGTVKFPYGTENNVYRIRAKQIDTLAINGTFINATTDEEMIWIRQSDGIPVLRFQKQGASNMYAWYASVSSVTSVPEPEPHNSIQVYPNPGKDMIYLRSEFSLTGLHYSIEDNSGRQVSNGNVNSDDKSIDVRDLSAGYYFLRLYGSTSMVFKIFKQ